jgi:polar amino acid transport system permease protein
MGYEWHFDVLGEGNLEFLLGGLGLTIALSVLSMIGSLVLGLLIGMARLSPWRVLQIATTAYSDFLRGTPLLVQLLWIYYSLPILTGVVFSPFVSAAIALTLNLSAFVSEIVRAGIQSIGRGQREAALALGMTGWQAMSRVILPQSIRRVIPPLGSVWVSLFKDTALVSVIAVPELMYRGKVLSIETYRPVEIYTVVALIYFFVTYPQARGVDWLFERARVRS